MGYQRFVLVVDDRENSLAELSLRLVRMGIDALYSNQEDEASLLAAQESRKIGALLVPSSLHPDEIAAVMQRIGERAGLKPNEVVLIGERPADAHRLTIRNLGVRWCINVNDDPVTVRSLLAFVASSEDDLDSRIEPRIPALLMAEIHDGERAIDARVRNLSVGGAFLETDEALDPGGEHKLAITLPEERLEARARVAFQVPADANRPEGVPAGSGVAFIDLDLASQGILRRFLADALGRYQI